jgi:hypothetical protein
VSYETQQTTEMGKSATIALKKFNFLSAVKFQFLNHNFNYFRSHLTPFTLGNVLQTKATSLIIHVNKTVHGDVVSTPLKSDRD